MIYKRYGCCCAKAHNLGKRIEEGKKVGPLPGLDNNKMGCFVRELTGGD